MCCDNGCHPSEQLTICQCDIARALRDLQEGRKDPYTMDSLSQSDVKSIWSKFCAKINADGGWEGMLKEAVEEVVEVIHEEE